MPYLVFFADNVIEEIKKYVQKNNLPELVEFVGKNNVVYTVEQLNQYLQEEATPSNSMQAPLIEKYNMP